jgi:hypothetical protein
VSKELKKAHNAPFLFRGFNFGVRRRVAALHIKNDSPAHVIDRIFNHSNAAYISGL